MTNTNKDLPKKRSEWVELAIVMFVGAIAFLFLYDLITLIGPIDGYTEDDIQGMVLKSLLETVIILFIISIIVRVTFRIFNKNKKNEIRYDNNLAESTSQIESIDYKIDILLYIIIITLVSVMFVLEYYKII